MEAERDKGLNVDKATELSRNLLTRAQVIANMQLPWTGAIVARDEQLRGGIGRVLGEPDESGIAWVYWGKSDHGKYETREVVTEMVRLDLNDEFMKGYKQ